MRAMYVVILNDTGTRCGNFYFPTYNDAVTRMYAMGYKRDAFTVKAVMYQ